MEMTKKIEMYTMNKDDHHLQNLFWYQNLDLDGEVKVNIYSLNPIPN